MSSTDSERPITSHKTEVDLPTPIHESTVDAPVVVDAGQILKLQAAILSKKSLKEAAATFATSASQLLGIKRVSVGFVEDGQVSLVAISHGASIDTRQDSTQSLAAVMEEAIDQAHIVNFPYESSNTPRITLLHAEHVRRNGGSVCSVPIVYLGDIVGSVTAEQDIDNPLDTRQIERIEQVVVLVGPLLALKRDSQHPIHKQAWSIARQSIGRLTGPGEHQLKMIVAGMVLAAIILMLVPMNYHISAPARLEGEIQRALVAPTDGFIQQVSVRPGDTVKEGQVLAEMATQDLLFEQRRWESELAQHENTYGAALAQNDRSKLMIAQAKVAESQAHVELAASQIERLRIKAPFDGIVISGDLSQSLGAPIQRGSVLMVIAPHDRYRLIVDVDERDIADLKTGANGRVSLAALPSETIAFSTNGITPVAVTRDGRHFFELEGKMAGDAPALRPGLQGVAKIDADKRTLAWALSHRFLVWLRLSLWTWTG